jgi:hypothetical protein
LVGVFLVFFPFFFPGLLFVGKGEEARRKAGRRARGQGEGCTAEGESKGKALPLTAGLAALIFSSVLISFGLPGFIRREGRGFKQGGRGDGQAKSKGKGLPFALGLTSLVDFFSCSPALAEA